MASPCVITYNGKDYTLDEFMKEVQSGLPKAETETTVDESKIKELEGQAKQLKLDFFNDKITTQEYNKRLDVINAQIETEKKGKPSTQPQNVTVSEPTTGATTPVQAGTEEKIITNDKENQQGLQSDQRIGQEPQQGQPIQEASREETQAGGILQAQEEVDTEKHPKYEEALKAGQRLGSVSTQSIQRRLNIPYNEAKEIIRQLKRDGMISAPEGSNIYDVKAEELPQEETTPSDKEVDSIKSLEKLEFDIEQLKKMSDAEAQEGKFVGMVARAWEAKNSGDISGPVYTNFRNRAQDILEAKKVKAGKNVKATEAKLAVAKAMGKVKERLLGKGYQNMALSAPLPVSPKTVADIIDFATKLAQRGIEAGMNTAEAFQKAMKVVKAHPAYKKLVASGELDEKAFDAQMDKAQFEIEGDAKSIEKPYLGKDYKSLSDIFQEVFGLDETKARQAAVVADAMVETMAKREGVSKQEILNKIKFTKGDVNELLKSDNALFQGKVDGKDVTLRNTDVDVVNGFYSPIEKRLAETKIEKQSANKWITVIGKGDEAVWTGVKDWLESKNPQETMSKSEILDWMKENRVSIQEIVKGSKGSLSESELISKIESKGYELELDMGGEGYMLLKDGDIVDYDDIPSDVKDLYYELAESTNADVSGQKYTKYQLEGEKENYKEVLVTLPRKKTSPDSDVIIKKREDILSDKGNYTVDEDGEYFNVKNTARGGRKSIKKSYLINTKEKALDIYIEEQLSFERGDTFDIFNKDGKYIETAFAPNKERAKEIYVGRNTVEEKTKFNSTHFDEPNILVHLRMNTRTDADGNKVLFLEEVQSDWGQEGKKKGFKPFFEIKNEGGKFNIYSSVNNMKEPAFSFDTKEDAEKMLATVNKANESKLSTAPFVTDTNAWTKLGLKVALKEAVKQGADKIAWTTGEQQNDRYDLSKQVDEIRAKKNDDGTYKINAAKDGNNVFSENSVPENKLQDIVGKDLAQKIIEDKSNEGKFTQYKGQDLQVGGKGMKGFYGSPKEGSLGIVGNVAKSIFKQEPKTTEINNSSQHSIDVTPQLRQEVEKGLALFQKEQGSKPMGAMQATADGGFIVYALTNPNVSTPLHELAHVYEHYLTDKERSAILSSSGTPNWTTETSEYFARGFEKYLSEGNAPTSALKEVFENFKKWLTDIYNAITKSAIDVKLNPDMRRIYAQMLGAEFKDTSPSTEEDFTEGTAKKKTLARLEEAPQFKEVIKNIAKGDFYYARVSKKKVIDHVNEMLDAVAAKGELDKLADSIIKGSNPFHPKVQQIASRFLSDRLRAQATNSPPAQADMLNMLAAKLEVYRSMHVNVAATVTMLESITAEALPLSEEGLKQFFAAGFETMQKSFMMPSQKKEMESAYASIQEALATEEGMKAIKEMVQQEVDRVAESLAGDEFVKKMNEAKSKLKVDLSDC